MFSISVLAMLLTHTLGQPLKVMFFGDSLISGLHDKDYEICPFRYEFLRKVAQLGKEVEIIGTNADPDGTCQKVGESLDVHNSGYQNSGTDELLDFIMADLQYLHKPVDYIFTSLGAKDCMQFKEGRDFQIVSQSIRRIMGRLLSINDKAKLVHIPILLPESAGQTAVTCRNGVNGKLREIYDDNLNRTNIAMVQVSEKGYVQESFYTIENTEKATPVAESVPPPIVPPATAVKPETSTAGVDTPPVVKSAPVVQPQTSPAVVVTPPVVSTAAVVQPQTSQTATVTPPAEPVLVPEPKQSPSMVVTPPVVSPGAVVQSQTTGTPLVLMPGDPRNSQPVLGTPPVQPVPTVEVPNVNTPQSGLQEATTEDVKRRRVAVTPLMFLPKEDLAKEIADLLIKTIDWSFRAHTFYPTPKETKSADYYGYDWCTKKYEQSVCFEYYYGYVWCTENYGEDACYDYYYGKKEKADWGPQENYKYCTNWYDEEYCKFAYLDGKPETWDWLSFGYHDCLKNKTNSNCFDKYYGYAWCLSEKKDIDCYQKYYGAPDWEWTPQASYKWCLNFHDAKNCSETYLKANKGGFVNSGSSRKILVLLVSGLVFFGCLCLFWRKISCFGKTNYSKLNSRDMGREDEVELL